MPELEVRIAAFAWLRDKGAASGGVIAGTELINGFVYEGRRITLKGAAGIWFPQGFSILVSITSSPTAACEATKHRCSVRRMSNSLVAE